MSRRSSSDAKRSNHDEKTLTQPFFLILYLVMTGGYLAAVLSDPSLRELARLALFTALMLMHGVLYRLSEHHIVFRRRLPAYFAVQAALAFSIGLLTRGHWLTIALYLALTGQFGGTLWPNVRAIVLAVLTCFALLFLNMVMFLGLWESIQFSLVLAFLFAFVVVYVVLFMRQAEAREQAQMLLRELESTHRQLQEYAAQVEELTLGRERERMARELHDTLAQGLAGLILQLEAADSYLESGDLARAQAVVQQAMQRARATLHEARRAIRALRPTALEQGNLTDALGQEIDQFAATTGVRTTFEVNGSPHGVSPEMAQDILRIVQESLTNVARHAQAGHVLVRLTGGDGGLQLMIQDDGVGFDLSESLERPDCFGLAGMQERASCWGGVLQVDSALGKGTKVTLKMGNLVGFEEL